MNRVDKQKHGFTIVELMLAMGFISALMLAIALTVVQIGNIYNRGLTYKDVNQSGDSIANELQRSIGEITLFSVSGANSLFIPQTHGGRLCTGKYSYIWNYGLALSTPSSTHNEYSGTLNPDTPDIRFVKALDVSNSYCTARNSKITQSSAVDLLSAGQHNLSIHSFNISSVSSATDTSTGQQLYNIEFLIGTNDQDALVTDPVTHDVSCKPPSVFGADPSYCSVQKFDITARAGNAVE